ncbi:hypothetical protein HK098_005288 [Nowakowskiella sp. JEL0407]|nr:hypothetical protein HK098_005288 [Nowakowskiella sp. JEL0407]
MSLKGLPRMSGNRGIAITIGNPTQLNFLKASITMLRKYGCNLPVEVWSFDHELKSVHRLQVMRLSQPNAPVTLRVADDSFNFLPLSRGSGGGFHAKVSAVINSGFEDLIFMDNDVFALQNPEYLFDTPQYKENGALFWPDYWKTPAFSPVWRWMGHPCVDEWEQESGIIVINKRKSWRAILLLWFINRNDHMRNWHARFMLGDKDLFRFSWRAAGLPTYFIHHWVTPGGFMVPQKTDGTGEIKFCGISMLQHDPNGKILFAHTNLIKRMNKRKFNATYTPFQFMKKYVPLNIYVPPGAVKYAWAETRGAKARFSYIGGYRCLVIEEGKREGVERKAQYIPFKQVSPVFQEDIYNELLAEWIVKDIAEHQTEQKKAHERQEELERRRRRKMEQYNEQLRKVAEEARRKYELEQSIPKEQIDDSDDANDLPQKDNSEGNGNKEKLSDNKNNNADEIANGKNKDENNNSHEGEKNQIINAGENRINEQKNEGQQNQLRLNEDNSADNSEANRNENQEDENRNQENEGDDVQHDNEGDDKVEPDSENPGGDGNNIADEDR